jgi:tetratricopeptide (TPR) repeat protein
MNLANRLGDLGEHDDAVSAADEAIGIYRTLAAQAPEVFTAPLAIALHNRSCHYHDQGRMDAALTDAEEATSLLRTLAADPTSIYPGELAEMLLNLSNRLVYVGREDDALAAALEAVAIVRAVYARQSGAAAQGLARALHAAGLRLTRLDRNEESLRFLDEAAEHYRILAEHYPVRFSSALADVLYGVARRRADLGMHGEALTATIETIDLLDDTELIRPAVRAARAPRTYAVAARLYLGGNRTEDLVHYAICASRLTGDDKAQLLDVLLRERHADPDRFDRIWHDYDGATFFGDLPPDNSM